MPIRSWIFALASLLLCGAVSTYAAVSGANHKVTVWTTDDGLPGNEVIAMTQTHDGYLWLGTLHGLARFDGKRFKVFDENNTPGLKSDRIVKLFEDSHSTLWVGTESAGVAMIQDGRALTLDVLGAGGRENRLRAACEDSEGNVWLYTADGQLCRFQNGRGTAWRIETDPLSNCRAMVADKSGMVWVGTDSKLFCINPKLNTASNTPAITSTFELTNKLDFLLASQSGGYWCLAGGRVTNQFGRDFGPYPWKDARIICGCEDHDGNLIVGTFENGVYWFDTEGKATHISSDDGLSHNTILSLCMDREGSLWVGTDGGGLDRVNRQFFNTVEQTRGKTIQSVCADNQGGLWIGFAGAGVKYLNGGDLKSFDPPGQDWYVQSVFVDTNQSPWVWASKLNPWESVLFQMRNGTFRPVSKSEAVTRAGAAIYQDHQGMIWAGMYGGVACWNGRDWKIFTTQQGLCSDAVQAIADDAQGNVWIGTGNGLNCLRDGKVTVYHEKDGLPSEDISSLYVDSEGVLWIGTSGKGLARFQNGKWTRYTTADGLTSNSIGYLLEDGQGNLWIGTPAGLMRLRKQALDDFARGSTNSISCRTFGELDGLLTGECTMGSQPGACRSADGKLWFPTIKGLAFVDPAQIRLNTNPPPVSIEAVLIDGHAQNTNGLGATLPQTVTVPPGKEVLEIQFTSLNLAAADKARFKYRMEGQENAWTEAGNGRVARYSHLSPGNYAFHVTACNEDGAWNQAGATLAFIVEPPFWRTWWFLSLVTLFVLAWITGTVYYLSTQRLQRQLEGMRQQQALEKERARIARDIHDQLGASMTQVSLLGEMVESDKNDPDEVAEHARQISTTARDTSRVLDEIVWTVNPQNDTLEGLINYICKYAQEYFAVAGLRYRLDVPAQLPDTDISPEVRHNVFLAAKESVTNVVRHAKATEVWLRLKLEPGRFILELQDNGRGPSGNESKSARNGLRNMQKRMEDVGGSFELSRAPEGGALVRLTVPITNR